MDSTSSFRQALQRALFSGSCASATSALALALRGRAEEGSAAGPLNGPSQWLWGEREAKTRELSLQHTATGYTIHHLSAIWWAGFYELLSGATGTSKSASRVAAEAAGITAFAFAVDYGLTPRRLRPGFEKHVSARSIALVYVAFAAGLAASTLLRRTAQRRSLRYR